MEGRMGGGNFDVDVAFAKLHGFDIDDTEIRNLVEYFKKKLGQLSPRGPLSSSDVKCLLFLLDYSTNVPRLFSEWQDQRRKLAAATALLRKTGSMEGRLKSALVAMDLSVKKSKKTAYSEMKATYELLYWQPGVPVLAPGKGRELRFSHHEIEILLKWETDRQKRIRIIDAIGTVYGQGESRNAIIQHLRRLKTKNLPAQEGSGMAAYSRKPARRA